MIKPHLVHDDQPIDSDGTCPGCGALDDMQSQPAPPKVQAWTCTACGMNWACMVVNPYVRAALAVVGLLPTPQQRTAALLDVMRAEVTRHSGKEHPGPLEPGRPPVEPSPQLPTADRPGSNSTAAGEHASSASG